MRGILDWGRLEPVVKVYIHDEKCKHSYIHIGIYAAFTWAEIELVSHDENFTEYIQMSIYKQLPIQRAWWVLLSLVAIFSSSLKPVYTHACIYWSLYILNIFIAGDKLDLGPRQRMHVTKLTFFIVYIHFYYWFKCTSVQDAPHLTLQLYKSTIKTLICMKFLI